VSILDAAPVAGITQTLVEWAGAVSYEDLSDEVVHAARRAVLDSLGVTLGGSRDQTVTLLIGQLDEVGGPAQATLVGHSRRTDVFHAAQINGVAAHVLDFDDTLLPTRVHASAPLLPALLAVGEVRGARHRDLLAAFVVGFELQARLALAMYPDFADRGWHGTGIVGPIAVAAAVGRLLGLTSEQAAHAMGLGATQGAGTTAVFGSMAKSLNLGRAGASGVECALLAERGFTSNPAALDGDAKWFRRYSDVLDIDALLAGLGQRWAIKEDGFKPYACGVVAHAVIDAVVELRDRTGRPAEDVAELHLTVAPETLVLMGNMSPNTELEAKFSVAYAAAAAFIDGSADPETFHEDRVHDPRYRQLLGRVTVKGVENIRQDEASVTLTTLGGDAHHIHVDHALGTIANPMTDGQLNDKFLRLAVPVLGADAASHLAEHLWIADRQPVSDTGAALSLMPEIPPHFALSEEPSR
jgi:2-methylcitrate dehydratase PrpD